MSLDAIMAIVVVALAIAIIFEPMILAACQALIRKLRREKHR